MFAFIEVIQQKLIVDKIQVQKLKKPKNIS